MSKINEKKIKIAIIGGGSSGMLLASFFDNYDNNNCQIDLYEKNNKLGKKLVLTGNGKCNFTNEDFTHIESKYNNEFIKNIYEKYDNKNFIKFMEDIGIKAKKVAHRDGIYYYPNNNKATSVYYNLLDKINANKVNVLYNTEVVEIITINDDKYRVSYKENSQKNVNCKNDKIAFDVYDCVIIATGGNTYKNTGSTGDGYEFAKMLNHKIIKPLPALAPVIIDDKNLMSIKSVRLDARVNLTVDGKTYTEYGEVQLNGKTISGIPIMNLSSIMSDAIYNNKNINLSLCLYEDNLDIKKYLLERKTKLSYKKIRDYLCGFIDDNIASVIYKYAGIKNTDKNVQELNNADIDKIANTLTNFNINVLSISDEYAQVTSGGVDTNSLDNISLMSKIHNNLYFIGEVLDIDGKCGGYNLQMCYTTAKAVYDNIIKMF